MLGDPKPTKSFDCNVNQWGPPYNPGIILRHSSTNIGGYAEWEVSDLPAGVKCAFLASCGAAEATDTFRGPLMEVMDSHSATLTHSESWADNKRIRIVFTVPSDGVVNHLPWQDRQGHRVLPDHLHRGRQRRELLHRRHDAIAEQLAKGKKAMT